VIGPKIASTDGVILARPPKPVLWLVAVALLDMIVTAALFSAGKIEELNPLMRPIIHMGVWHFCLVKSLTIAAVFVALQIYRKRDEIFVVFAARLGVFAYLALWIGWFLYGRFA